MAYFNTRHPDLDQEIKNVILQLKNEIDVLKKEVTVLKELMKSKSSFTDFKFNEEAEERERQLLAEQLRLESMNRRVDNYRMAFRR
jgi:hypothetical protein